MNGPIEREVVFESPAGDVWTALTEPGRLSDWFGAETDLRAEPGATATFRFPDGTERRALVERVTPGRRLVFRWLPFERGPDGRPGPALPSRVEIDVSPVDGGTRVRIVETPTGSAGIPRGPIGFRVEAVV